MPIAHKTTLTSHSTEKTLHKTHIEGKENKVAAGGSPTHSSSEAASSTTAGRTSHFFRFARLSSRTHSQSSNWSPLRDTSAVGHFIFGPDGSHPSLFAATGSWRLRAITRLVLLCTVPLLCHVNLACQMTVPSIVPLVCRCCAMHNDNQH